MFRLAPSLLSADFAHLARDIRTVEEAGADFLHVDVMDGRFVPNITIGPVVVRAIKRVATIPLDVHLMIVEPEKYIEAFVRAGADIITVHAEATVHLHRLIHQIKEQGVRAGVAINPATPLVSVENVLEDLDLLLVMTVNPGFGGQQLIPHCLEKLKKAAARLHDKALSQKVLLEADGGIHADNISQVLAAGANVIVSGSGIFKQADPAAAVAAMKRAR